MWLVAKCTEIYNACRTIVRLTKPLVLRCFRCRCGLCKVPAVVVYKKSRCRLISVLFASNLWFKPRSHWKIPSEQLTSSTLKKDCTICPRKCSEIRLGIFGRMVSAPSFLYDNQFDTSIIPKSNSITYITWVSLCVFCRQCNWLTWSFICQKCQHVLLCELVNRQVGGGGGEG